MPALGRKPACHCRKHCLQLTLSGLAQHVGIPDQVEPFSRLCGEIGQLGGKAAQSKTNVTGVSCHVIPCQVIPRKYDLRGALRCSIGHFCREVAAFHLTMSPSLFTIKALPHKLIYLTNSELRSR